jgi:protein-L-isoaspartate(D-aspartate) O-methyltransferase
MNVEQARFNMIEQQIRPWNVLDKKVLELLTLIKREKFLPESQQPLAFMDTELPLVGGGTMLSPKMEARIVQEVAVKDHENVLVVGAGTGYLPALLAYHARHVTCVESSPTVVDVAKNNLHQQGIGKVCVELGDAVNGWAKEAPYHVIVLTGSLTDLPQGLTHQLAVGGRLFVVLGSPPIMTATLITRVSESEWVSKALFETSIARAPYAKEPSAFSF